MKQEEADKERKKVSLNSQYKFLILSLKDEWNRINTPTVPHPDDSNLDASEDEEDELPSHQNAIDRMDDILAEVQYLMDEDDEYNRKKAEQQDEEEEE